MIERRATWLAGAGGACLLLLGVPDAALALWCAAGLLWLCARYWSVLSRADASIPRRSGAGVTDHTTHRSPATGGEA